MKLLHDFGSCCSGSATAVVAPPPSKSGEEKRSVAVVPLLEHYYRDGNGGSWNKLSITRSASSSEAAHGWRPALSAISEESPVVSFAGDTIRIVRKGEAARETTPLQRKTTADSKVKSNSTAKPKSSSYCRQIDNNSVSSPSPMVMASFSPAPFMF